MFKYFLTTCRKKNHRKLSIVQKRDLYLNQFSNEKGSLKRHPLWTACPHTHLYTKFKFQHYLLKDQVKKIHLKHFPPMNALHTAVGGSKFGGHREF